MFEWSQVQFVRCHSDGWGLSGALVCVWVWAMGQCALECRYVEEVDADIIVGNNATLTLARAVTQR